MNFELNPRDIDLINAISTQTPSKFSVEIYFSCRHPNWRKVTLFADN